MIGATFGNPLTSSSTCVTLCRHINLFRDVSWTLVESVPVNQSSPSSSVAQQHGDGGDIVLLLSAGKQKRLSKSRLSPTEQALVTHVKTSVSTQSLTVLVRRIVGKPSKSHYFL